MQTRKRPQAVFIVCVLLGYCAPSSAHQMPVEFWVLSLMPSCQEHVDGFATKSEIPYAHWRRKYGEELSAYEGIGMRESDATQFTGSDSLRRECEDVLNYILDDIRPPDPRFASPQDTWNVFLQASRSGDKATIAECFAAVQRAKYMSAIDQMTPAQLANIAGSFTGFQLMGASSDDLQEAWVNKGDRAGIAHFVRTSRGWLLSQLP